MKTLFRCTDTTCSKTPFEWQSSVGAFSDFNSFDQITKISVFSQGNLGFSSTFDFKENSTLTEVSLEVNDFDETTKTFEVSPTITTCFADTVCLTMKVDLL